MNWKAVALGVAGLFLGLILISTITTIIFGRRRGTCPAVAKGQQILKQAEQQNTEDSEDYL
jgi:hypothetical protein